jgi:hypothetical protein
MTGRSVIKADRLLERNGGTAAALGPRDVAGAWVVCLIVAAASLAFFAGATPMRDGGAQGLIDPDPAATVAVAEIDHAKAHHERRC